MIGIEYSGQYFTHYGPWPLTYCTRLCRQYPECFAFVMEWVGMEKQFGDCGLIHRNVGPNLFGPSAIDGRSLFGEFATKYSNSIIHIAINVNISCVER